MIDVQVRSGVGEIVQKHRDPAVDAFFQLDPDAYPMLVHIKPWCDTAFNQSQAPALMNEIDRYEADSLVNASRESFAWLREMVELVIEEPHRMLWFVGD